MKYRRQDVFDQPHSPSGPKVEKGAEESRFQFGIEMDRTEETSRWA